jgi:hypothetical protein
MFPIIRGRTGMKKFTFSTHGTCSFENINVLFIVTATTFFQQQ